MTRISVFTEMCNSMMVADSMTIHGDTLFVYLGDELVGMFRTDIVKAAYRTEAKT